jgi:DNA-binding transcriptional ArsR family regulator
MSVAQLLDEVPDVSDDDVNGDIPDLKVIEDLATLRLLSDPLRLRLIEELGAQPTTVKALAKAMGMKPNRLYYHVNLLEQHGLVRVTQTRIVSGIVERTYALVARHFAVSEALALPTDVKRDVTDTLFRVVSAELGEAVDAEARGGPANMVGRMQLWLTEDERAGFETELGELLDKYGRGDPQRADIDAGRYTLLFALYSPVDQSNKRKR